MAFSLIANVAGQGDPFTATTAAVDTTGADLLVAILIDYAQSSGGTAPDITDSKSNSWTVSAAVTSTDHRCRIAYATGSLTVGSGHTFTTDSLPIATYPAIAVLAFSGVGASPLDQVNSGTTNGATSLATGSVTPSENNELVVAAIGANQISGVDGGFTLSDQLDNDGIDSVGVAAAYLIQTTATAANPVFSWVSSSNAAARIATFKAAAVGGVVVPVMVHHLRQQGISS